MTLKQLRRQAAQNGQTGREPADLRARLPDDFPNETTRNPQNRATQYPKTADKRLARRIVRMLEYTTVVKELDRFLRNHPGQQSRISTKALLLGMVLAAYETGRYLRSDICSYLNGLDYRLGIELGLWTWDTRHPVTYTMTQKTNQTPRNSHLPSPILFKRPTTASSSGGCSLVDCRGRGGCASCVVVVA